MVSPTSSASGLATPTGQVEFFDGSTLLDTANLSRSGQLYDVEPAAGSQSADRGEVSGRQQLQHEQRHDHADRKFAASNRLLDRGRGSHGRQRQLEQPRQLGPGRAPTTLETAYFTASVSQYAASNVDTSFSIANLTIDTTWAGSIVVSQPLTISGNLILASGTLGGSGAISVAGGGSQFSGGTLSGNVTNAGTLTVAGSRTKTLGGTLTNTGTIDVTGAGTIAPDASGATINNQAGAIFDFQAAATLSNYDPGVGYPGAVFNNAGMLEMTASSGISTIEFSLNDTGTVDAASGTLSIASGASATNGVFDANGSGVVLLNGNFAGSFAGSGSGEVQLASFVGTGSGGATLDFTGVLLQLTGTLTGTVTNTGTMTIAGSETLGGTLTNTGTIDVTGAGTIAPDASGADDQQSGRCHL